MSTLKSLFNILFLLSVTALGNDNGSYPIIDGEHIKQTGLSEPIWHTEYKPVQSNYSGLWKFILQEGRVFSGARYFLGHPFTINKYSNVISSYHNGKRNGKTIVFSGYINCILNFKNGELDGMQVFYVHPFLKQEICFNKGKPDGVLVTTLVTDSNKVERFEGMFKNGIKNDGEFITPKFWGNRIKYQVEKYRKEKLVHTSESIEKEYSISNENIASPPSWF